MTSRAHSFTTIRYLIDADRNIDVPVGIVLCNTDRSQLFFRLPTEEERITNVPSVTAKASLELAKAKIERWLQTGEVPYAKQPLMPLIMFIAGSHRLLTRRSGTRLGRIHSPSGPR